MEYLPLSSACQRLGFFFGFFSQLTSFFLLLAANENSVEPVVGCISILYVLEVE